jgi:formate dehydrogenase major subunit
MTNGIGDVENAEVIFVIGSNPRENHPVIGAKIKEAKRNGAKLIIADPRKIDLSNESDLFLQLKLGTNIALINGMIHVIIEEGLEDRDYIETHTENYRALKAVVEKYTPEHVAPICGVKADGIREMARIYASGRASIFYAMGITQHKTGTNGVISLSNLAQVCGNIGIKGGGINPLRGQNNVQGACDMGGLPDVLTCSQDYTNPVVKQLFEGEWGTKLPQKPGLTIPEIMDGACSNTIKCLFIMGENPMLSDPDMNHIRHALDSLDFLIVQDIFLTETAERAHVVLPAMAFAEKDGTFTNTERRVQRVRKAVDGPGESKEDWRILMELMNRLGQDRKYAHPREIMDEIARLTPPYRGISYERIENAGLQWPVPHKEHMGTPILHANGPIRGKGYFCAVEYEPSAEQVSATFPYLLTNGRNLYHYHTRTMTGRVKELNEKSPCSYVEINPLTLEKLGLEDGSKVKITSARGHITTHVKSHEGIMEELFFMPFHFADGAANVLTGTNLDEKCGIPELKVSAVNIEPALA